VVIYDITKFIVETPTKSKIIILLTNCVLTFEKFSF